MNTAADRLAQAVAAVESVFQRIALNMVELPVSNPALTVEAVGFRPWSGVLLGVLVTPWNISLMLLPDAPGSLRQLGCDQKQAWDFPAGQFEFFGRVDAQLGVYQSCSLFSPPFEFSSHADARLAALACLDALFSVDPAAPQAAPASPPVPAMSRRAFLGRLAPGRANEGSQA